jgi:hypothetical protein
MTDIMTDILANILADKNRSLSPVYDNFLASYCQTLVAQNFQRHLSKHIGRQKPGKYRGLCPPL